jgi:hypothetical protein
MYPTKSLVELVEQVNENNTAIPKLRALGYWEATIYEEAGADPEPPLNGDIAILHSKNPTQIRIGAKKDIIDAFDAGSDGERIWLHLPQEDVVYVGTVGNIDPAKAAGIPFRPDVLVEVLGINLLPTRLDIYPAPALEFNPDTREYEVTFVETAQNPTRLIFPKQVWFTAPPDGSQPLPVKVILSDPDGRPILRANLSRHRPIGGEDGPLIATQFDLFFPETGSTMLIRLDEVEFSIRRRGVEIPNESSFRFEPQQTGAEIRNLDRGIN